MMFAWVVGQNISLKLALSHIVSCVALNHSFRESLTPTPVLRHELNGFEWTKSYPNLSAAQWGNATRKVMIIQAFVFMRHWGHLAQKPWRCSCAARHQPLLISNNEKNGTTNQTTDPSFCLLQTLSSIPSSPTYSGPGGRLPSSK